MAASISRPRQVAAPLGRLWWLPPTGTGNGLDDSSWVPIADIRADAAGLILAELRAGGIPAHAAPLAQHRRRGPARTPRQRLWVGASCYGRAEQMLLRLLSGQPGGAADARA